MSDWLNDYRVALHGKKKLLGVKNKDLRIALRRTSDTTIAEMLRNPQKLTLEQFEELNKCLGIRYKIVFKA